MPFFEDLKKSISTAGQGVAQSTKNFAEVTKMNSAISDREKQINALYMEIGRTYYEKHHMDEDCDLKVQVDQINDLYQQIQSMQEQIKVLKGFTKCPVCGADVPNGAKFCNTCGTPVEVAYQPQPQQQPPVQEQKVCPVCGAVLAPDCVFCTSCGAKLN